MPLTACHIAEEEREKPPRSTAVRSSGSDLTVKIDRACLVDWVKRGPSNLWRRDTKVQFFLEKCAKGVYGRKGKVFRGFGLVYLGLRWKRVLL